MGLWGHSQCLSSWNTASHFPDSQFPTRQPHSPGGGLPVGELGPDPRAVLMDRPDVNGQYNRCSVGQMGAARGYGLCGSQTPSPNTFVPTWPWYYARACLTMPQTQRWWARFVTTWLLPGCRTASSCCHLTRSGKLLIGIMKPPPEWGWSDCINQTRSSQTYTSSTMVNISRFWVCRIRRYGSAQLTSSWEATWCTCTWQRTAGRHMLCFPLVTCWGHLSNSLSHIPIPSWWYWISGATSDHSCYLPGSEGKVHSEPGEILHCRSSGHQVVFWRCPHALDPSRGLLQP